jgi:hypothetical protein
VSVVVAITAMQTVLGLHASQDLQCLTIKNVERIAKLVQYGLTVITVANVSRVSFG